MKAILVNAGAGQGKAMRDWPRREAEIRAALGGSSGVQVEFTTAEDHGAGIAAKLAQAGATELVVVGGDGTLANVFSGLMKPELDSARRNVVVSIMPAGRGNDFFRATVGGTSLGESMRWERALENLRKGVPRETDLASWQANGGKTHVWMNVASFGFPGLVVHKVNEAQARGDRAGSWTYVLRSLESFGPYRPIDFEVEVDGESVYSGPVFSGFVLNGFCNAGGVRWSRTANPFDGLLEVFIQEPKSLADNVLSAPRTMAAMASGNWDGMKGMHRVSGKRVRVRRTGFASHPVFEIDGEQTADMRAGEEGGVEFQVLPAAIRFRSSVELPV